MSKPFDTISTPIAGAVQGTAPSLGTGGGALDNPPLYTEGDAARMAEERLVALDEKRGIEEVPGDLGKTPRGFSTLVMLARARREAGNENVYARLNMRARGPRETSKFIHVMGKALAAAAKYSETIRAKDTALAAVEDYVYPTDAEIQNLNHLRVQLRFHEWVLLRDRDKRWFQ